MKRQISFILDFDSTIVRVEALEELAEISLAKHPKREERMEQIRALTTQAMEGKLSFTESLRERLALLEAHRDHLDALVRRLRKNITPSFERNKAFLKKHADNIYVITGGFREYVLPTLRGFSLRPENIYGNTLLFDPRGRIIGVDESNPLAHSGGKVEQLRRLGLEGEIYVLGDGYTDYEMRQAGLASKFFAFTESIERDIAVQRADTVVKSFDEFLYFNKLPMRFSYPKSKINVLLLENVHEQAVKLLEADGLHVEVLKSSLDESELLKRIENVSLLGIRSKTQLSKAVLSKARRLMGIGAFCIGTDQIDLDASDERGIVVFNAPFSNTRSVVELALGEILMLMRRVPDASAALHRGEWKKTAAGSFEIRGKKLGIVGYGNIGSQLSVLAELLGMEVYYYDIVEKLALGNARKCRSLDELLRIADVVTLHVDGRPANRNLIGKRELQLMKHGALLLNLSRGAVVDLAALREELESGRLAGAGIDVYPDEPLGASNDFRTPLQGLTNVILSPHIGGSTEEAQERIGEYVAERLIRYVNQGESFGSVNFPQIQLPPQGKAHRLLHIHRNAPGVLAEINNTLAEHKINILGQYLRTTERIGYVITDVNKRYNKEVVDELRKVPHTIKFRVLH